jgi:hypothetical protein
MKVITDSRSARRALSACVVSCLLAVSSGCGMAPTLEWGLESPRAVAQAAVDALTAGDASALERLALNEREFATLVWPRQPAARPERNIPREFAWRTLAARSRHGLRARLSEWSRSAGQTVVGLTFTGDTTDYGTYRVYRKSVVTLRDASGRLETIRIFGSVIEQGGRYRVFSYVID